MLSVVVPRARTSLLKGTGNGNDLQVSHLSEVKGEERQGESDFFCFQAHRLWNARKMKIIIFL